VDASGALADVAEAVRRRVVGNDEVIEHMLIALLACGHLLLESPPGLGKTEMSKALADALDLSFRRIQCTPDLTPKDVVGELYCDQHAGMRFFERGPVFANVVLVDEINRAQPKTQAAFLEAMSEGAVTVGGHPHRLPEPFIVLATQNPVESEGTYPLPEAQEDRFLFKSRMRHLAPEQEKMVLKACAHPAQGKLLSAKDVMGLREAASHVRLGDDVLDYIVSIVGATRARSEVSVGASTRASVMFGRAVRARAHLRGRGDAAAQDALRLAHPLLRHRLVMSADSRSFGYTSDDLVDDILRKLPVPSGASSED
jgi:MoxR-like ATPase